MPPPESHGSGVSADPPALAAPYWLVELTCCGRDGGNVVCRSWQEADAAREAYTSGPGARPYGRPDLYGHERSGVVRRLPDAT